MIGLSSKRYPKSVVTLKISISWNLNENQVNQEKSLLILEQCILELKTRNHSKLEISMIKLVHSKLNSTVKIILSSNNALHVLFKGKGSLHNLIA